MKLKIALSFILVASLYNGYTVSAQDRHETLSAHVLDNEFGGNAVSMTCMLYKLEGNDFVHLSTENTDSNGRVLEFIPLEEFVPGTYKIWFGTKDYYNSRNISTFFPAVQITFDIRNTLMDHHIPLVLSPYGFSTYRVKKKK